MLRSKKAFRQFKDFSPSAANDKYVWTAHSRVKMRQYGLSESRVKRIIRFPLRYEEGIIPKCIAVMQPAGTQRYSEIWAMYKLAKRANPKSNPPAGGPNSKKDNVIKVITAWRYPGVSPQRDPIPQDVLEEIKTLL